LAIDELIEKNKKYDLILFDVYWSNSQIPTNLTKLDFLKKIKKVLDKNWIFSINMSDFEWKNKLYQNIHNSLKSLFWEKFTLFQTEKTNISNCMWIYNLEIDYTAQDFDENYKNLVKNNLALYSNEIIKNTIIDEEKKYLK
jgi:spermidine synthase